MSHGLHQFPRTVSWLTVAALVCGCLLPARGDDQNADRPARYRLVYKFVPGQKVHYDVQQTTERRSKRGEQHEVVTDTVHERKHLEVLSVEDDGSFVLKTVYDHVTMEASFGGGQTIRFDSKSPAAEDPRGFGEFRKMITNPAFHVQFGATGELMAVQRLAAARAAPTSRAGRNSDGSSFLVVFPDREITTGQSWTETYAVNVTVAEGIQRKVDIFRTYRLREVRDGIAKISFSSSFKVQVRDPKVLAQLVQTAPAGTVDFDIEAGQIVRRTMQIDRTVLNPAGPQSVMTTVSNRVEKQIDADTRTAQAD